MCPKLNTSSDAVLLCLLKNGDHEAFRELYRRYWRDCYLTVLRKSNNTELAEDITQVVFESLWQNRRTTNIKNLPAYLMNATRYRFVAFIKAKYHMAAYEKETAATGIRETNHVENEFLVKEILEAVQRGVSMMPPKTKEVYMLSREKFHSIKEIAEQLQLTEKAVEYHITKSLRLMRLVLKDFFPILIISVSLI